MARHPDNGTRPNTDLTQTQPCGRIKINGNNNSRSAIGDRCEIHTAMLHEVSLTYPAVFWVTLAVHARPNRGVLHRIHPVRQRKTLPASSVPNSHCLTCHQ